MSDSVLNTLSQVIEQRKNASAESSYVASLHKGGLNEILKKVGEESTEAILAAKDAAQSGNNEQLIYETADLWFHSGGEGTPVRVEQQQLLSNFPLMTLSPFFPNLY